MVLLSLATLASAWSAFQAALWSGHQAVRFNDASAARIAAEGSAADGNREVLVDLSLFVAWAEAATTGQEELARYYENQFSPALADAFEEWLAGAADIAGLPEGTPFDLDTFAFAGDADFDAFLDEADVSAQEAADANRTSDRYVLSTVLYAAVLFLAGIATKFATVRLRVFVLSAATLVLGATTVYLLAQPRLPTFS